MCTLKLKFGQHYVGFSSSLHKMGDEDVSRLIKQAKSVVAEEQLRRGDGLPDGYRIIDERGLVVHEEWLGTLHAANAADRAGLAAAKEGWHQPLMAPHVLHDRFAVAR